MLMLNEPTLIFLQRAKVALLLAALLQGTVLAQDTSDIQPQLAHGVSLQFVQPQKPPDYDTNVLIPLHKAQAEEKRLEAQREAEAAAAAKAQAEAQARIQTAYTPPPVVQVNGSCHDWMVAAGVTDLVNAQILINMESGCDPGKWNRAGSGACGIPQALPCSKLPGFPNDPVAQIRWMQSYVFERYGSWANAVAFHLIHNWY
jgi:hypothetical protein